MENNGGTSSLYRIRFHGRGGQGMKTASRILGSAFFREGFQVQDAPRYGAERRGAPIFAYVRASRNFINERGIIHVPDLIIVADETLLTITPAVVLSGALDHTILLINTAETAAEVKKRVNFQGVVVAFPAVPEEEGTRGLRFVGMACAGAAARLVGVISRSSLETAIMEELSPLGDEIVFKNLHLALRSYDLMERHGSVVTPGKGIAATDYREPEWLDVPFDMAKVSAPAVFTSASSERVKTGFWRTERPVLDRALCKRCSLCAVYCPENAIIFDGEGYPSFDYDHCKGCLLCVEQCPARALKAIPEHERPSARGEGEGE